MKNNITIVTAFITRVNTRKDRDVSWYLERGKKLLSSAIPKVVFIQKEMISIVQNIQPSFNHYIVVDISDIYLYKYRSQVNNVVTTNNPLKDTIEYFMVQCNKTEWIREAIILNKFKTDQFVWMDFGIYQFYEQELKENNEIHFERDLTYLSMKNYNKIRFPYIWPIEEFNIIDKSKNSVLWFFPGSLFGGNKINLLEFANRMKIKCLDLVQLEKTLLWEVNIWPEIYFECLDLFDLYFGDHSPKIITNY
jgi:hypothetical protein